ncbi:hypothetical protein A5906_17455 [Bradyrhizobium sacchari]|nr:hypothetical protein A5906_17455 [Bradyrhizobium sacchari]
MQELQDDEERNYLGNHFGRSTAELNYAIFTARGLPNGLIQTQLRREFKIRCHFEGSPIQRVTGHWCFG